MSGQNSAKLTPVDNFAMTLRLPEVKWGQTFMVSAWMVDPLNQCRIVASGNNPDEFYYTSVEHEEADSAGWSKRSIQFTIPRILDGKPLVVYLYYTGEDSVYCDDFRLQQYDHQPLTNF